jgi:hypothetical protein
VSARTQRQTVAAVTLHRVRPRAYVIRAGAAYLVIVGTIYADARGRWHGRTLDGGAWPLSTYGRDRDDVARRVAAHYLDAPATDTAPVSIGAHVRPDDTAALDAAHYGIPTLERMAR